MKKVTIIIPVYNLEEYINMCLDSCLEQDLDYDEYEILCVDDGSTDKSRDILEDYVKKYSNIKIIYKDNGGVSSARNAGIKSALGKYIWFVDGDDYIPKNCLGFLYNTINNSGYDLLKFDCLDVYEHTDNSQWDRNVKVSYYDEQKFCFTVFPKTHYANGPVFFWFYNTIIKDNNLLFNEDIKYAEDTLFVFDYMMKCRNCVLADAPFYYYYQRPDSAMHTMNMKEHLKAMKILLERYHREFVNSEVLDRDIREVINNKQKASVQSILWDMLFSGEYTFAETKCELKKMNDMGVYPYKPKFGINKNKKQFFINAFSSLFQCKWCYLLMKKILLLKK